MTPIDSSPLTKSSNMVDVIPNINNQNNLYRKSNRRGKKAFREGSSLPEVLTQHPRTSHVEECCYSMTL